ncbi:hypothetical protein [Tenacibaculum sp. 190524A02b]|uniref:Lipocalin-like domain-containing protein n=1 Tax=Tenacibaculum vairaonense TaxID=3137860 RepID=A0ABM9PII3_9FLAO
MKKLFTFFILTSTLLLSCSSNESDITFITNNDIIGNWRLVDFKIEGITKGIYKNSNVNGKVISHGKNYNFYFNFNDDHQLYLNGDFTTITTSTSNGVSKTIKSKTKIINGFYNKANWLIDDKNLKLISTDGYVFNIVIEEFYTHKMILKLAIEKKQTIKNIDFTTSGTQYIILER